MFTCVRPYCSRFTDGTECGERTVPIAIEVCSVRSDFTVRPTRVHHLSVVPRAVSVVAQECYIDGRGRKIVARGRQLSYRAAQDPTCARTTCSELKCCKLLRW